MASNELPPLSGFSEYQVLSASNDQQTDVIRLIESCYAEYGDRVILDGDDNDLLDLVGNYRQAGGEFLTLIDPQGVLVGCHAVLPLTDEHLVCSFKRLYLDASLRGSGLGRSLMQWAIDWATGHGFSRVEFWSDARFKRAHQFFRKMGFQTSHITRQMDDNIQPYNEFFFWLDL